MDTLSGLIERVTYHNEENGFCVIKIKAAKHRDLVTVLGHAPMISAGEYVSASGTWVTDREHGLQFKAEWLRASPPTSAEGMEKYLGSGMVKGIGPVYAAKLIEAFGTKVFEVIETSPKELLQVKGIGKGRLEKIERGWADQKAIKEIMLFLYSNKVSTAKAVRIYRTYGTKAIETVQQDPYCLARDIIGIGFLSADQIARNIGISQDSPLRVQAGIAHALLVASNDGHCGLPKAKLISLAEELLSVKTDLIETALVAEIKNRTVCQGSDADPDMVYLASLFSTEKLISKHLIRLVQAKSGLNFVNAEKSYAEIKDQLGITLSSEQESALLACAKNKVFAITGGPGCGKTTLVNGILKLFHKNHAEVMLCAPTGRAAKRLAETTGFEASTIHRLLGFKHGGQAEFNENNPLDCDLIVADEQSMTDVYLMLSLLRAVPDHAHVLLVGDIDQLPPVGPGMPFSDIMDSGAIPVARLNVLFRQAAQSQIIVGAHAVNAGKMPMTGPPESASDFVFIEQDEPEAILDTVKSLVTQLPHKFKLDPVRDIQVLSPMNKSSTGCRALNTLLQSVLNTNEKSVEKFGVKFIQGDKVMQTVNNYDKNVYNGDIGTIQSISEEGDLVIEFGEQEVPYVAADLDEIQLAYACTVHKLQGSETPVVILVLTTQHYALLQRNLVYTGITRGKKLVIVVGQKRAMKMAVHNYNKVKRNTRLALFIHDEIADLLA